MTTSTDAVSTESGQRAPILRALRVGLHVMFAVLLGLGLLRTMGDDGAAMPHRLIVVGLACALALVYVLGTSREYRSQSAQWTDAPKGSEGSDESQPGGTFSFGRSGRSGRSGRWLPWAWLAVITLIWVILLLLSADFVWLAFPLMFLFLHLLPMVAGVITVLMLWVLSWLVPLLGTGDGLEVAGLIGSGIGAVLAVVISLAYRRLAADAAHHQRIAAALRAAQAELAATEHRAGAMEERERLAREIHDTLAQGLSSMVLVARAGLNRDDLADDTRNVLATLEQTAADNLTEARRFVRSLSTPQPTSLAASLQRLATRYETELSLRDQPLDCRIRFTGDIAPDQSADRLPEPVASAVLRAVQVGLGNVAAHAQARHTVITVGMWTQEVTVDIFDDGAGFTVPQTLTAPNFTADETASEDSDETGSGYGLFGLQRRVDVLGGTMSVESAPGAGTVLAVRIPLTSRARDAEGAI